MLSDEMKAAGWRDMVDAPQDGTIFVVRFHEWNVATNPVRFQLAQSLPLELRGGGHNWHSPWAPDSGVYADGWMPLEQFATYRQEQSHD